MKVLMFTWEFPPHIAGGLGMACYGIVRALLKLGIKVDLVLPTKDLVYFPLAREEDVDLLPVVYLEPSRQTVYDSMKFSSIKERMDYIGVSEHPESYIRLKEISRFTSFFEREVALTLSRNNRMDNFLSEAISVLTGDEELIKKVQEYSMRAEKIAKVLRFDLIHAHDWLCYPAGMIAAKISNKPLINHIHATEFDRAGGPGDDRVHKIEFSGMMYADKVIAVSQYTAQMIMSRYRIDSGRIKIVHNAFTPMEGLDNRKKRLFKGTTVLFLGRITLQKGPDYFIEVAEKVVRKHPQARFIIAGTGDMGRRLLRRSASLKLKNTVLFTGFLNRKQVELILRAADIYVLPSVSEPFGIAPLEAMAYGITSIISKQSGVAEVVNNAFKIDFWDITRMADTICYLIENPELCEKIGLDGKQEVSRILWDETAEKIREVYSEVLKNYLQKEQEK